MNPALTRRLRPLYFAAFLQSFMLWYAVEKLFMRSIGFDDSDIGFMVAVYSVAMLVIDIPSGLLADRWSRKGVLIVASLALTGAALVGGVSNSIGAYLFSAILWGAFYACYAGMYESTVYDTLAEENQPTTLYRKVYGKIQMADSAGLVTGGLASIVVATQMGLRETYFLSVPFALLSILALLAFREPRLHKNTEQHSIFVQIRHTFLAITRNNRAVPVVLSLILKSTVLFMMFEFAQLWLIALEAPTGFFGFAGALLYAAIGFGGWGAQHLHATSPKRTTLILGCILASIGGLIVAHNIVAVAVLQFVFIGSMVALSIALSNMLHDLLPSHLRASAASATSTLGRLLIIPLALLFGYVSEHFSIFSATYILLALALAMSYFVWSSLKSAKTG